MKWPMDRVDLGLYEHLQHLQQDEVKLERLHRMVREVACWFDYLQPMEASLGRLLLGCLDEFGRSSWGQPGSWYDNEKDEIGRVEHGGAIEIAAATASKGCLFSVLHFSIC